MSKVLGRDTSTVTTSIKAIVSPAKLAHVVLRTSKFDKLVDWYVKVLGAKIAFSDGGLAFLSYDEEHHRVAVINVPGLMEQPAGISGVHHMAFTYASLSDLVLTYERLREIDIVPVWCVNHGPTTSMYYADPDGNQVELQIDNYDTVEEAGEFFFSQAFAINPIGVDFQPEDLAIRFRSGEREESIKVRPQSGKRGVDSIKLR
ncbi:VOC family protein [Polaromonas sp.]|uniref:VOC family protein n=1 Tax=Polaromonas sp. TaxID=1869339 RepID=UPI0025E80BE8|nr:VOC family protein [Polaromonas sp.]